LQPNLTQRPSIAIYDQTEAELALRLLRQSLADASDPNAPRIPGKWCRYCRAITGCEEARTYGLVTTSIAEAIAAGRYELPTGAKATALLDAINGVEPIFSAIKEAYKKALRDDPSLIPDYFLKNGRKIRQIKDVHAAWTLAHDFTDLEEFLGACSLSITELTARLRTSLSVKEFNTLFESVITRKSCAPELARKETL
jgi:hypothetical protein